MTARHVCLLVAISLLTFFTALGTPRLWDRDEPRNARATLEMMQRDDWVVPTFNGELRTHKPVLVNWFMRTAFVMFPGQEYREFAARFWSAALAVGTVLMTYAIGRRLFNATAGVWAGAALASNLQFPMMARLATPEMLFVFWLTAAKLAFVLATFKPKDPAKADELAPTLPRPGADFFPRPWWAAAVVYALMGVAVLAKGPAGAVLPTAVIGMFLLVMRLPPRPVEAGPPPGRWRGLLGTIARPFEPGHFLRTLWSMRPITALLVIAAVALPWYAAVWRATDGAWVRGFLFEHNIGRAAQPMEGHGGSLLLYPLTVLFFYPIAILVGFFPWSLLCVPVGLELVRRIRRRHPWAPGYVFVACWAGVYVGAFAIARTKLASYMTPMYPAVALLTGAFVYHWVRHFSVVTNKAVADALRALPIAAAVLLVGLPIGAWVALPQEWWVVAAVALVPLAGGLAAWRLALRERRERSALVFAGTAVCVAVLVFAVVVVRVDGYQHSRPLLDAINERTAQPRIATFARHEPSWVFYANQQIDNYESPAKVAAFLSSGPDAFVITSDEKLPVLRKALPPGAGVIKETPYFGKSGKLLVIGHTGTAAPPAGAPPAAATATAGGQPGGG